MGRFDGSVALVTGASRGIGLGIAQRLVDEGARVCVTARRQEALDAAVEQLGGPEHAMAVAGKADDLDHQRDTVTRVVETFGSLDLLVNNTGINPAFGPLVDAGPRGGPQDRRGQLHRGALAGFSRRMRRGSASTEEPSSTSPRSPASSRLRGSGSTAPARRCSCT